MLALHYNTLVKEKLPSKFWKEVDNQRLYFEWAGKELGITKVEDWYKVSTTRICQLEGASAVLYRHGNSLAKALQTVYPDHTWLPWYFKVTPRGFWTEKANQRRYMDWLGKQLNITHMEDWHQVDYTILHKYKDAVFGVLRIPLESSVSEVHSSLFQIWKFERVPKSWWSDIAHQRQYLDHIAKENGIDHLDKWYTKKTSEVKEQEKLSWILSSYYGGSLMKALVAIYPEHQWHLWKFVMVPRNFWTDINNQRNYFAWLSSHLGLTSMDDWYSVKVSDVCSNFGAGMLHHYDNSLHKALSSVYPDRNWIPHKFERVPNGYWDKPENAIAFMNDVAKQTGFTTQSDWQQMSTRHMASLSGTALLRRYGGLSSLLSSTIQTEITLAHNRKSSPSKVQYHLFSVLKEIFPQHSVILDFVRGDVSSSQISTDNMKLYYSKTRRPMQLDVCIPDLNLGFEYQGLQHYKSHFVYGTAEAQQLRDKEKLEAFQRVGVTVIEVPFWWDEKKSSLISTVAKYRPDVLKSHSSWQPIPEQMPSTYKNPLFKSLDLPAHVSLKSVTQLGQFVDPAGWWIVQVPRHVRCYWDGRRITTINGASLNVPESITKQLPQIPLEIYLDSESNRIVVFDAPSQHELRLAERIALLKETIIESEEVTLAKTSICSNRSDLDKLLTHSLQETILIAKPDAYYYDDNSLFSCTPIISTLSQPISPFVVELGKPKAKPICRGCSRTFTDHKEPRIQTCVMYSTPGCGPRPIVVSACLNVTCVQETVSYFRQRNMRISNFEGVVKVGKDIDVTLLPKHLRYF